MTADEPPPIDSEEDLATALRSLLLCAHENGVDVEGGWECRNGSDRPDWDVVVTEVEKVPEPE